MPIHRWTELGREGPIRTAEERRMVRKETCPRCKGNRWVKVTPPAPGKDEQHAKCPECGGQGFKIRMVH